MIPIQNVSEVRLGPEATGKENEEEISCYTSDFGVRPRWSPAENGFIVI